MGQDKDRSLRAAASRALGEVAPEGHEASRAAAAQIEEKYGEMRCKHVKLKDCRGHSYKVETNSAMSLFDLHEAARDAMHVLKFVHNGFVLAVEQQDETLESLGITEDSELGVVRRDMCVLEEPGVSRFNANYFCIVHQARLDNLWNRVELDCTVEGDGSLGPLQPFE
eukprot:1200470-Amphidinium_carterae.1